MSKRGVLGLLAVVVGCGGGAEDAGEVDIIRGEDGETWLDLTVAGQDIGAGDGTVVIIQIGMPDRPPERLGHAVTHLANGGFSVDFPSVWEYGLYKKKVILVDVEGDGGCGEGDTIHVDYSASLEDRVMTAVAPAETGELWGDFFVAACTDFLADWPAE